jgi:hypothetical protein
MWHLGCQLCCYCGPRTGVKTHLWVCDGCMTGIKACWLQTCVSGGGGGKALCSGTPEAGPESTYQLPTIHPMHTVDEETCNLQHETCKHLRWCNPCTSVACMSRCCVAFTHVCAVCAVLCHLVHAGYGAPDKVAAAVQQWGLNKFEVRAIKHQSSGINSRDQSKAPRDLYRVAG